MGRPEGLERNRSLRLFTTLKAGGPAERFLLAYNSDQLRNAAIWAQENNLNTTVLGWGSNILPADKGVPGLVIVAQSSEIEVGDDGVVTAGAGVGFQELFLYTAQRRLAGLEFAVGIPGTVGGALVSNAGAYRSNVSEFLTEIEVVRDGKAEWVDPSVMEFAYRDSILRRPNPPQMVLVRVRMKLPAGPPKPIYDEAREYQRQRISKQPPPASAGSFFKNVYSQELADRLDNLPQRLKEAGVVPAGYLIEKVGMKGHRHGGAQLHWRHANFMTNVGGASAMDIRRLAAIARNRVRMEFQVDLEEEVLYLGDWSGWEE